MQRMITAHGHNIRALSQHGHRASLFMDASGQGSMRMTPSRLNNKKVQAHAWSMFIAFGILLPAGIIYARCAALPSRSRFAFAVLRQSMQ